MKDLGKRGYGLIAGLIALGLCCFAGDSASALTPPPLPAELVYANGGRILKMEADGSKRTVLTNRGIVVGPDVLGATGDSRPRVSPDGTRMLLTRRLLDGGLLAEERLYVAAIDGSGARRILGDRKRVSYDSPAWMPDGSIVAVRWNQERRRERVSIIKTSVEGGPEQVLLKLRPHLHGNMKQDLSTYFKPLELAASPDGSKLLITMSDGYKDDHRWLELADLETGKRRNIAPGGYSGTWSPDGTRIAYAANRESKGEVCDDENACRPSGDLYIAGADGSNRVKLTGGRADENSPAWSPDGNRIAFSSNRNYPRSLDATEIYTITPEGECETWLTNGVPASADPAWIPGAGDDSGPGACGAVPREPLTELRPLVKTTIPMSPRLWAGPAYGTTLFSADSEIIGLDIMRYDDCAVYDPADCASPVTYASISACFISGIWAGVLADYRPRKLTKRRGVVAIQESKRTSDITVFSGGSLSFISQGLGDRGGPGKAKVRANLAFFKALRPIGSATVRAKLPPLRVPKLDLRIARAIKTVVRRQGSVRKAAKRLDIDRKTIREFLAMPRTLKRFGKIRPINCPADFDPFAGFDGRSISAQAEELSEERVPDSVRRLAGRLTAND